MENSNRSNENTFVEFFKGLDENYQFYLINEMKKPPDRKEDSTKAVSAGVVGDPKSR
ncbi:hypothetical protein P7D59_07140 [Enterococcus avium]|uniref:hypothetical protein n=1 Tax=Enterococcus avium TaxID=33945 RepID=UPI0014857C9B|nr:hypothetical protein [Enterococcus avium]MDT2478695.1 hypothetical protein [Enterococcus avium]